MGSSHSLEDKFTANSGAVFMSGTQALVRLPMAQMRRDRAKGLNTAAFITGYRGSPLGAYDLQLFRAKHHLDSLNVRFQPGVNEDLAATAIWGTQQVPLYELAKNDGVVGIWYGKGPGVDRSGDVFRHGNAAGTSSNGGVLCLAGDDHAAKSSTVPHQSDHAFMSARMPMLFPSSVHEFIEVGLLGIALSRFSGCWVGMKVISDTVETSAVVSLGDEMREFVTPDIADVFAELEPESNTALSENGLNLRWPDPPMVQDKRMQEQKEAAVLAFARANKIDQTIIASPDARFGIVASGKAFEDVRQALHLLGIDNILAAALGVSLYKVRMPYPLEPQGIIEFATGLSEVIVFEERREIIEHQIKQQLYDLPDAQRPVIIGKRDEAGHAFLPTTETMSIAVCAQALAQRLLKQPISDELKSGIKSKVQILRAAIAKKSSQLAPITRNPWFCSGCPHNSSTKVPEGSKALAGIGCHYMVQWMDRSTDTFTQMGAEGMPWTAIAHYVDDDHRFVNIGDGTYFHSGLLAIRGGVASGVNVTYKVLYNDAVAMTGGQAIDGGLTPAQITHQLKAEGVAPIFLVSDEPELYPSSTLAAGVHVRHREDLDTVMRQLRELKGCNAIVYVQTCAAEKRRRRKRGLLPDPKTRMYIHPAVCEGCGDCSTQSNCVSIEPLETAFGRKRKINQSSCNKDYTCKNGFCPAFVTINDAELVKQTALEPHHAMADNAIAEPALPSLANGSCNVLITGVGGTGVLTIGSLLGMAAQIDGHAAMILDIAGLAQKGGAVVSHVRLAKTPEQITSPHIVPGGTDVLIAADSVVASSTDNAILFDQQRTQAIVNTTAAPVADFVLKRDFNFKHDAVASTIKKQVTDANHFHAFSKIAEQLTGDAIASNILMLGYAWQQGLIPVSREALRAAIELNAVAVDMNLGAFEWGRMLAHDPGAIAALLQPSQSADNRTLDMMRVGDLIEHRKMHLQAYQNKRLAKQYAKAVERFRALAEQHGLDESLVKLVAHSYARVLSYKDEFEVARLFSLPEFKVQMKTQFAGEFSYMYNMAPPFLNRKTSTGRPKKRKIGSWFKPFLSALQHGRLIRNTPLNVFGYTAERRAERRWIKQYESDLEAVSSRVSELPSINQSAAHIDTISRLLSLPDTIRGFGPVKQQSMDEADKEREKLLQALQSPLVIDLTQVA